MVKEDNTFKDNLIRIGENAEDNDNIIKESNQTDIWFHLHSFPSCHVIISCSKEFPITNQMINHCGSLVKDNTKYKNFAKLKVNYTEIKNVKRTETKGKVILKGKIYTITV